MKELIIKVNALSFFGMLIAIVVSLLLIGLDKISNFETIITLDHVSIFAIVAITNIIVDWFIRLKKI